MEVTIDKPPELTRQPARHQGHGAQIAGAVGVVLLVSTPLTWVLSAQVGPLIIGKLALGLALVIMYLTTHGSVVTKLWGSRSAGLLAMTATSSVLVFALVGAVNYLAFQHPKELDLTREGLHTLSQQTTDVLGRLKGDVLAQAFLSNVEPQYALVEETLGRYAKESARFRFEMVDPQARPDLAERFQITQSGPRIVLTAGGESAEFTAERGESPMPKTTKEARAKDSTEEELTNAVIKVAEQSTKTVHFLTGHGEADMTDGEHGEGLKKLSDGIANEGYQVEALSLVAPKEAAQKEAEVHVDSKEGGTLEVPATVSVLVLAGARGKLFAPEVAAIDAYLARGGRVLALLEPNTETGVEALAGRWNIDVLDDFVVDTNPLNRLLGLGPAAPMVQPTHVEHAITRRFDSALVMMSARSLRTKSEGDAAIQTQALLETGEAAWGETRMQDGTASRDAEDHAGPVVVAMAATRAILDTDASRLTPEGRLVVFGDSDWVTNQYVEMQGNRDVALNAVHWLAEQEERITIRPKTRAASRLMLTGDQLNSLKFLSMDLLPVLVVAFGLGVVMIRRQR